MKKKMDKYYYNVIVELLLKDYITRNMTECDN